MAAPMFTNAEAGPSRPRPAPRPFRIRPYVGPMLLLCAVTSFAFNRARLARQRDEDHRQYLVQTRLLQEETARLSGSSRVSAADDGAFLRRCIRAGLDPTRLGLASTGSGGAAQHVGPGEQRITWGEALMGKGTLGRMRASATRAVSTLKESFGSSTGKAGAREVSPEEQRLEEEWDQAFLAYAKAAEEQTAPSRGSSRDEAMDLRESKDSGPAQTPLRPSATATSRDTAKVQHPQHIEPMLTSSNDPQTQTSPPAPRRRMVI